MPETRYVPELHTSLRHPSLLTVGLSNCRGRMRMHTTINICFDKGECKRRDRYCAEVQVYNEDERELMAEVGKAGRHQDCWNPSHNENHVLLTA